VVDKNDDRLIERRDIVHLAILVAIALVIGVYLIATTVLIAKDGVFYIERAQQLTSDPVRIIKAHPPGYPFLIMAAHKCASLFTDDPSVFTWIYSAQSVTLLCRLLALILLYFIGKLLAGSRQSFWAMLILIFLPYPTRIVCDVVREWPYLLFLATGFFFLLWSVKSGEWWAFGLAGLSCGLGYLIRPESAQLIIYGLLWGVVSLFRPKLWGVSRWKNFFALALLLIGFAIPAAPYMKCTGKIIPLRVTRIMKLLSHNTLLDKANTPKTDSVSSNYNTAGIVAPDIMKALGEIFKTIGESLMWFFLPALMIGLCHHFRINAKFEDQFLITTFIIMNIAMMVLRYCYIQLHVSQRWSLPLITFTIFYVPIGLQVAGKWLNNKRSGSEQKIDTPKEKRLSWFVILLFIGLSICLPKLLRPVRIEKQDYENAAEWLSENTTSVDIVATPDKRITFYAECRGVKYKNERIPEFAKYIVKIVKDENAKPKWSRTVQEKYSGWVNKQEKKKRIIIYEVL